MECYLRATLVQGEKRSFNHAVGRERKQPSGYSWTGGREGIKKRSPDFQLIKLSRARGLMKAPLLELARNRSRANICPLFAICTGQKFRTLSQRYNKFLSAGFFLIVVICRALCGNINKLSKAVKIFNDCVTPNNRKSICFEARVIYTQSFQFFVFSLPFSISPTIFFIFIDNATVNSFMNYPVEQLVNLCGCFRVFSVS